MYSSFKIAELMRKAKLIKSRTGNNSYHAIAVFIALLNGFSPKKLGLIKEGEPVSPLMQDIQDLADACQGYYHNPALDLIPDERANNIFDIGTHAVNSVKGAAWSFNNWRKGSSQIIDERRRLDPSAAAASSRHKPDLQGRKYIRDFLEETIKELDSEDKSNTSIHADEERGDRTNSSDGVAPEILSFVTASICQDMHIQTCDDKVGFTPVEWVGIFIGMISAITPYLFAKEWLEQMLGEKDAEEQNIFFNILIWVAPALSLIMSAFLICRFNAEDLYTKSKTSAYKAQKDWLAWTIWWTFQVMVLSTTLNSPLLAKQRTLGNGEDPAAAWQTLFYIILPFTFLSPLLGNTYAVDVLVRQRLLTYVLKHKALREGLGDIIEQRNHMIQRMQHSEQLLLEMPKERKHAVANSIVKVHSNPDKYRTTLEQLKVFFELSLDSNGEYEAIIREKQAQRWYHIFKLNDRKQRVRFGLACILLMGAVPSLIGYSTNVAQGQKIPNGLFGLEGDITNIGYFMGVNSWLVNAGIGGLAAKTLRDMVVEKGISSVRSGWKKVLGIAVLASLVAIPGFQVAHDNPPDELFPFTFMPGLAAFVPFGYLVTNIWAGGFSVATFLEYRNAKKVDFNKSAARYPLMSEVERRTLDVHYDIVIKRMIKTFITHLQKVEPRTAGLLYEQSLGRLIRAIEEAKVIDVATKTRGRTHSHSVRGGRYFDPARVLRSPMDELSVGWGVTAAEPDHSSSDDNDAANSGGLLSPDPSDENLLRLVADATEQRTPSPLPPADDGAGVGGVGRPDGAIWGSPRHEARRQLTHFQAGAARADEVAPRVPSEATVKLWG